jgi:hypothetical protein
LRQVLLIWLVEELAVFLVIAQIWRWWFENRGRGRGWMC